MLGQVGSRCLKPVSFTPKNLLNIKPLKRNFCLQRNKPTNNISYKKNSSRILINDVKRRYFVDDQTVFIGPDLLSEHEKATYKSCPTIPEDQFDSFMEPYKSSPRIVVATSGGVDSMTLTFLLTRWAKKHDIELHAVTIDHQVRPNSAAEAQFVHDYITKEFNINHIIRKIDTKNDSAAVLREKRYNALDQICRDLKSRYLFAAHHLEDQSETLILRLRQHTGLDGLACMYYESEISPHMDIVIVRPLLDFKKENIISTCLNNNITWVEDQSNTNLKKPRNLVRHLIDQHFTKDNLDDIVTVIDTMKEIKSEIYQATDSFFEKYSGINWSHGFLIIRASVLFGIPEMIAIRIISKSCDFLKGKWGGLSEGSLHQTLAKLKDAAMQAIPPCVNHHGVNIQYVRRADIFTFTIEPDKKEITKLGQTVRWTNWDVTIKLKDKVEKSELSDKKLTVDSLGSKYFGYLGTNGYLRWIPFLLPAFVLKAVPAIFHGSELIAAPTVGFFHPDVVATASFTPHIVPSSSLQTPVPKPSYKGLTPKEKMFHSIVHAPTYSKHKQQLLMSRGGGKRNERGNVPTYLRTQSREKPELD